MRRGIQQTRVKWNEWMWSTPAYSKSIRYFITWLIFRKNISCRSVCRRRTSWKCTYDLKEMTMTSPIVSILLVNTECSSETHFVKRTLTICAMRTSSVRSLIWCHRFNSTTVKTRTLPAHCSSISFSYVAEKIPNYFCAQITRFFFVIAQYFRIIDIFNGENRSDELQRLSTNK